MNPDPIITITTRQGTIPEALLVLGSIPEFAHQDLEGEFRERLTGRENLILVSESYEGLLIGFKVGYALDSKVFYSWLGGVVPDWRRSGPTQQMLDIQEMWAVQYGYDMIRVKSMNRYPGMLHLLIGGGYPIVGTEPARHGLGPKILFEKSLKPV